MRPPAACHHPTRRRVLKHGLRVFGAALPLASNAQSALSRLRGSTVRFHYPAHPHYERVERQLARFTAQTGIRVDAVKSPYLEMKGAQRASFAKPTGDFDLVTYLVLWKVEYAQRGWLRALEPLLADAAWAVPGFGVAGLIDAYVDAIGRVGGPKSYLPGPGARLYGLPCGAETSVLLARKDLLQAQGLPIPTTYDELLHAGRVLRERTGIAALASRGQPGHHITHAWLLHLTPHAGTVFDEQWNSRVHGAGGVRATQVLRQVATLAADDMPRAGFAEMQAQFLGGRAAFYLDSSSILGVLRESAHAELASRVAIAMHPSGSRLSGQTGGFGIGIAGNAAQPEAALVLMQWLLSEPVDLAIGLSGGVPARWATLANPDFKANRPEQSIMPYALRAANPDWRPLIPEWEQISLEHIGRALPGMVFQNQPIEAGLAELSNAINGVLQRSGRRGAPDTRKPPPTSALSLTLGVPSR